VLNFCLDLRVCGNTVIISIAEWLKPRMFHFRLTANETPNNEERIFLIKVLHAVTDSQF
jgi:hypothetical protein